jgi:hypothetical protein
MADVAQNQESPETTFAEIRQILKESAERAAHEDERRALEDERRAREDERKAREDERRAREIEALRRNLKETDRMTKENLKAMGYLNNRFGELAEHLIAPNILEKFNAMGYEFTRVASNMRIKGPNGTRAEIDLFLEDGVVAVMVEVKSKPLVRDVDDHKKRMALVRENADAHQDRRKYLGAIAGAIMSDAVRNYALKCGFYVIEQSGDTVKIDPPPGFVPREW